MKLESDILFSAAAHLLFVIALFFAGRNAVSGSPERYIQVALVSHEVPAVSPGEGRRKRLPGTVPAAARGPAPVSRKRVQPDIHHKTEVKVIPAEHNRTIAKAVHITAPLSKKKVEAPKNSPPEDRRKSTAGGKKPTPVAEEQSLLSGTERFTFDISRYTDSRPSGGIVGPGIPLQSPEAGSSPSARANADGGAIHGVAASGKKGRNEAIGAIRAAIERAKSYPPFARKSGMEGTVTAEFSINGRGRPENVRIKRSSGFAILDSAAKETIIRAAPFPVVEGKIEIPIAYRLRQRE